MIEWKGDDGGLFSNLTRVVEWIYCVKHDESYGLHINMSDAYGYTCNVFPLLFKEFEDPQIFLKPNGLPTFLRVVSYPGGFAGFSTYPTNGMTHYHHLKFVYMNRALYDDPDFSLFRHRLYPFIARYIQPVPELQEKIDTICKKLNGPSYKPNLKIGIHVRYMQHYQNCDKGPDAFLNDVERDIDEIMASKDPKTTQIFLATLLQPLVDRLKTKYNIVICDIPRAQDVVTDWNLIPQEDPLDMARDVIVDTWCLAHCDEVWGSSSNMIVFIGCLNPHVKIYMLPSLKNYNGA